jgi:hypothetical protein
MLTLTDTQLEELRTAAAPLPPSLRSAFLQKVAELLDGRDYGDADVHRAAHAAVRELLTPPRPQPKREEVLRGLAP